VAIDLQQADITNATQAFLARYVRGAGNVNAEAAVTAGEVITASDIENVGQENLNRLLTTAAQTGVARLSPGQVLLVVLVWLLVGGLGAIQQALSPEAQAVFNGDVGYVALGLTITATVIQKRGS
jgi:hypothetical protein